MTFGIIALVFHYYCGIFIHFLSNVAIIDHVLGSTNLSMSH